MKDGDAIQFFTSVFVSPVLVDREGRRLTRTMRRTDRMQTLMDYYYEMVPTAAGGPCGGVFVLSFRGTRVIGWTTPADIELEDEEEIIFLA
jgi:small ubiquitin-related modifier